MCGWRNKTYVERILIFTVEYVSKYGFSRLLFLCRAFTFTIQISKWLAVERRGSMCIYIFIYWSKDIQKWSYCNSCVFTLTFGLFVLIGSFYWNHIFVHIYVCSGQFVIRGFSREYKTYMENRICGNWEFDWI